MSKREDSKEIESLRDKLRHHEYAYYVMDDPEISDAAFDRLMNRLKELEAQYPDLVTADSPTVRVGGAPREGFLKVRHQTPMVSLDNALSLEALAAFDRRVHETTGRDKVDYVAEHKFDGLSLSLIYENGSLVRGVSGLSSNGCRLSQRRSKVVLSTGLPSKPSVSASLPPNLPGDSCPSE